MLICVTLEFSIKAVWDFSSTKNEYRDEGKVVTVTVVIVALSKLHHLLDLSARCHPFLYLRLSTQILQQNMSCFSVTTTLRELQSSANSFQIAKLSSDLESWQTDWETMSPLPPHTCRQPVVAR